jgi:hypothetical protein
MRRHLRRNAMPDRCRRWRWADAESDPTPHCAGSAGYLPLSGTRAERFRGEPHGALQLIDARTHTRVCGCSRVRSLAAVIAGPAGVTGRDEHPGTGRRGRAAIRGSWKAPYPAAGQGDAPAHGRIQARARVWAIVATICLGIFDGARALAQQSPPTILSLTPTAGHAMGGYHIAVSGRGFAGDAGQRYTCRFSCSPTGPYPQRNCSISIMSILSSGPMLCPALVPRRGRCLISRPRCLNLARSLALERAFFGSHVVCLIPALELAQASRNRLRQLCCRTQI